MDESRIRAIAENRQAAHSEPAAAFSMTQTLVQGFPQKMMGERYCRRLHPENGAINQIKNQSVVLQTMQGRLIFYG